jgi:PLP dependent protein
MSIIENYQKLRADIASTAIKCGRNPADISLIVVTKEVDWQIASILYQEGLQDFGENRVAEALTKKAEAPLNCRWHFIGNLQKNKINKVIGQFELIHSVDSFELAEKLSKASLEAGLITSILLQANTSGEVSKHGLTPAEWKSCFEKLLELKGISIQGLMTMAPLVEEEQPIRHCFRSLRKLRDELNLHHLSMGMSHDYRIAIEEGATLLRIGTILFGR